METDVAIIGGGLSGLSLARHLQRESIDFQLFEGRTRFGGRVFGAEFAGATFDLGPSWFWPGQPRMATLTNDLGLETFDQYSNGALIYETEHGDVQRDRGFSSMQGSYRIKGGMPALIDALRKGLPTERLHLNSRAVKVAKGNVDFENGTSCKAKHIVMTLPPRLCAGLTFDPPLDPAQTHVMESIPTWMAGHAKFVAVYDHPFWRENGLSGDAMSRKGPMVEIHDASGPNAEGPGALFGFIGVPAQARAGLADPLKDACLAQLANLFGEQAANPATIHLRDWAYDPFTATDADLAPLMHHPAYLMPPELAHLWNGTLHLCSSEAAPEMGGFLEGALAASEAVAANLVQRKES